MADSLKKAKIAHASFWFIDAEGRNRVALRGDEVELDAKDYDRGERHGAFVVEPEPEPEEPETPASPASVPPAKKTAASRRS